jgi:23S rRNA pseudouridine2605 synthase
MVSRLIRTRFGPIALPRGLRRGQARPLTPLEVTDLLKDAPQASAATREAADSPSGVVSHGAEPGRRKVRGKPQGQRGNTRAGAGAENPARRAPRTTAGRQAPAGTGRPVRGPGAKKQGGKGPGKRAGKRPGVDRGSLTLDGRRASKPKRRDDDDYVAPPPPQPIITHRRSRLKIMPPEGSQEG